MFRIMLREMLFMSKRAWDLRGLRHSYCVYGTLLAHLQGRKKALYYIVEYVPSMSQHRWLWKLGKFICRLEYTMGWGIMHPQLGILDLE